MIEALLEALFELAIKGPGYLILRCFRAKSAVNPDGCLVVILGFAFWLLVGLGIYGTISVLMATLRSV